MQQRRQLATSRGEKAVDFLISGRGAGLPSERCRLAPEIGEDVCVCVFVCVCDPIYPAAAIVRSSW